MPEYIDREKLLKTAITIEGKIAGKYDFIAIPVQTIKNAPTEDVAPVRHGRWLPWKVTEIIGCDKKYLGVFCSMCELHADSKFDYCPNCGAKMDGVSMELS